MGDRGKTPVRVYPDNPYPDFTACRHGSPLSDIRHVYLLLDELDHDAFRSTDEGEPQAGVACQRTDGDLGTSQ